MNEKIKQLAQQSQLWDSLDPRYLGSEGGWSSTESRWGEELQEFAELIVRECVAVIEPGEFMQGTAHDDTKTIIALNQRKIRKHFGVEG